MFIQLFTYNGNFNAGGHYDIKTQSNSINSRAIIKIKINIKNAPNVTAAFKRENFKNDLLICKCLKHHKDS